MAEAGTFHDAFIDELRDTYDAERQLTKALAKLAKASSNPTPHMMQRSTETTCAADVLPVARSQSVGAASRLRG